MAYNSTFLWKWEISAIVCTSAFLVIMAAVLVAYDGKPIFDWHNVTLNAVISVLSTASKAALMFAVAESISQWKWILFANQSRPLMDMERVDSANRGPLGSARLLWPTKQFSLLRMGAAITVLALAIDPFTQQLVQYEQHLSNTTDVQTTIARAKRYSKGSDVTGSSPIADFGMQSGILYGLVEPYETVVQQTPFTCVSGNCTWSTFESLAVCSVCNNLTDQLTAYSATDTLWINLGSAASTNETRNSTRFRLPNGLFIDNENGMAYTLPGIANMYMTTFGTGNTSKTNSLEDNDSLIYAMSILRLQKPSDSSSVWPNMSIEAIECGLFYCVKQYDSAVQNGTLYERETEVKNATRNPNSWQIFVYQYFGLGPETSEWNNATLQSLEYNSITSGEPRTDLMYGGDFNISQPAINSISNYFQTQFSISEDLDYTNYSSEPKDTSPSPITLNGFYTGSGTSLNDSQSYYSPSVMQVLFESANINDTFRSLARSMSNAIRAGADNCTIQTGQKGVMTTYYRIQWPWIALHASLVITGTVFLVITIFETKKMRVPAWKSNSLSLLSCTTEIGDVLAGVESTEVMEAKASQHFVRLFEDKKYHMVGEEDSDLVPAADCPRIGSIKKVRPLSVVRHFGDPQMSDTTPPITEAR